MTDRQEIITAMAALEAQRLSLGETVTETTLDALRQQLARFDRSGVPGTALRGERKQVTVMFADISGFTAMSEKLDPEEVRSLINACFERLGTAIGRYGGHIDKFIGDEIMALFGAPSAHENDAERSLRAALEMVAVLAEFNQDHAGRIPHPLALHFGINTGLVITGGIGTRQRQDYSVMGDTVNLAARLEDLSEAGQILVGEATYRVTAPLFEFEALRPAKIKGKAQPVRVYRLLSAKATPGGQIRGIEGLNSPLVGRAEELATLDEILTGVCDGRGGVVSVVGEVGLGKSRLVAESCLNCHVEGKADWFEGQAVSYGENAGYLVARAVLRNMLGLDLEASSAKVELALRAELQRHVPDRISDIYPYLAHVLDIHLDAEANQRIKYLEGEALSQQISESVRSYVLARTKKAPLILVWEDLHWADPSSLGLLEALLPVAQACALLLILVYRPRPYSQTWAFQQRVTEIMADDHKVIKLVPLSPQRSGQLLDNLLGSDALPETVRELIVSKAEGNPFYLEEVIRSLINSQAIARAQDSQAWVTTPGLSEIRLPNTLQGVIMARIDKLEPETKRVLQIASVVGRNFPYKILEQVVRQVAGVS